VNAAQCQPMPATAAVILPAPGRDTPSADQAAFSIAFDKPNTVFAVVIREIPKIHRQANPSRRESCLEESVAMSIDSEEFAILSAPYRRELLVHCYRCSARCTTRKMGSGDVSAGLALVR
jgi:hypothetical protein